MLDEISSKEKSAILIRTLEEGWQRKVIEYMTAEEKEVLLREIAKFRVYKPETLENVLGEFLYELNVKELNLVTPDKEYIRRIFKTCQKTNWKNYWKIFGITKIIRLSS